MWTAVSGAAVAADPIAGGALAEASGWRAVFLVNVPLGLVVLALAWGRAVRCPRGANRVDWPAHRGRRGAGTAHGRPDRRRRGRTGAHRVVGGLGIA
ncbi:hypothetical protein [Streptomyces sp. NPDC006739]|uniref:hypothetical protein n=1 Tax=Streptomyces sp. NPDC006739 TaxID=3364763 RepID=UPI00368EBC35